MAGVPSELSFETRGLGVSVEPVWDSKEGERPMCFLPFLITFLITTFAGVFCFCPAGTWNLAIFLLGWNQGENCKWNGLKEMKLLEDATILNIRIELVQNQHPELNGLRRNHLDRKHFLCLHLRSRSWLSIG